MEIQRTSRKRKDLPEDKLEAEKQKLLTMGFVVKIRNNSIEYLINNRWWQPPRYRGPYRPRPTDAPTPWTGVYDSNLDRWVNNTGRE